MLELDPRLTPARGDLAARHLLGQVEAERFVEGSYAIVSEGVVDLRPRPEMALAPDTQLLFGEQVTVYEQAQGWAWVQSTQDGYVGYVPDAALTHGNASGRPPSHRIASLGSNLYSEPALKIAVAGQLPFGACVCAREERDGFTRISDAHWVPTPHLASKFQLLPDWVAIAELFLGVPYLWGGRSNLGLDCSALIQLARQAAGHRCLRDSDMQAKAEGETLPEDTPLQRGDLLFWRGHVGVMSDPETLLHANGHHMAVVYEPVHDAIARIQNAENSPVTRRSRFSPT